MKKEKHSILYKLLMEMKIRSRELGRDIFTGEDTRVKRFEQRQKLEEIKLSIKKGE